MYHNTKEARNAKKAKVIEFAIFFLLGQNLSIH
jgi:hypothetical protein